MKKSFKGFWNFFFSERKLFAALRVNTVLRELQNRKYTGKIKAVLCLMSNAFEKIPSPLPLFSAYTFPKYMQKGL